MAARLKTRLSAGAALVTGLGMMGVATALPAHAETTATYECAIEGTDPSTTQDITVTFDTTGPGTVAPGNEPVIDSVTATATIPLAGAPLPSDGAEVTVPFSAPMSTGGTVDALLTSESITVGADDVQLALTSHDVQSEPVPVDAAGQSVEVLVPGSFDATLSGFTEGEPITVQCTAESTDTVIDTVVVTSPEMEEAPDDAEDTAEVHEPADEPAVPRVVQTDGLTPRMLPQEDDTLGYALGGLLLAGAGAGTVLVARRRSTQH